MRLLAAILVTVLYGPTLAAAQSPSSAPVTTQSFDGHVLLLGDVFPNVPEGEKKSTVAELRPRIFAEYRRQLNARLHVTLSGFAEALVADRSAEATVTAAIVRPQELHLEARWEHADLRIGWSRVVWGRLDEFLPTDVVNPQDLTRFFFDSRSEARMPVAMVRGRWLPSEAFSLEGIFVPLFRSGRYDQLDEPTAPFNVRPRTLCVGTASPVCVPVRTERLEPRHELANAQGGLRATATTGRIDWAVSAYRGFDLLPLYDAAPLHPGFTSAITLIERFPRLTMLGGDFETVRGPWGVRGEVAAFVDRSLQAGPAIVKGRLTEAGLGIDRRAGDYRVSGYALLTKRTPQADTGPGDEAAQVDRTDLAFVTSIDRSFARATRAVRIFGAYNPGEQSAFARAIALVSLRDNLSLEASVGLFSGSGADVLARFSDRDFVYTRLKVFF